MIAYPPTDTVTLTIAREGRSPYAIVIPAQASASEQRAAAELQQFVRNITGAELRVVRDDAPEFARVTRAIALGQNRLWRDSGMTLDLKALGEEGFAILPRSPHLFILGSPKRGTMYGVYAFLEDDLGCRWHSSKVSRIPKRRRLRVTVRPRIETPAFEYREPFFTDAWDKDWAARNRINGSQPRLDESTGGKVAYGPFVHTFYALVPPQEYAATHPEYYSLVNGARNTERAQLCLTHPDVLRIACDTVRRWIRENPQATIFSVSQNDWEGACECASCRKVVEEEGAQSGVLLRFVNAVAEQIEKEYPDKLIDTLAYWYTEDPPRHVRPRRNVRIRLAPIGACFAHPFGTCEQNRKQFENLRAWSRITDRLYIWHYVTNFAHYLLPFPNLDEMGAGVRIYKEHGVVGLFYQGNYSEGGGGEFNELRAWVLAKLMWNPNRDYQKTVWDFLSGYYGAAAPHLRRYLDLMHAPFRRQSKHLHIFDPPNAPYLEPERLVKAERIFDAAENAVRREPELLNRVQHARLSVEYTRLQQALQRRQAAGDRPGTPWDPETRRLAEIVATKLRKAGITNVHEWNPVQPFLDELDRIVKSDRME